MKNFLMFEELNRRLLIRRVLTPLTELQNRSHQYQVE